MLPITMEELQKEAHETAINKGWHDTFRTVGELLVLCHSELSEALEDYRASGPSYLAHIGYETMGPEEPPKPVGFPIELADLLIRVADLAELWKIDLTKALRIKLSYNKTRPIRHGGKFI